MQCENTTATCKLFTEVSAAWEAMLVDCKNAQTSIYFEQYIFVPDVVGKEFLEVFKERARQGVQVYLLFDTVGSWTLYKSKKVLQELAQAGVVVRWYNKITPLLFHRAASYVFRNHRKVMVIDGIIGYTGGVCVRADMEVWRDTYGRLVGSVVGAMRESFLQLWEKNKLSIPHLLDRPHPTRSAHVGGYVFLPNSPSPGKRFLYHSMRDAIRYAQSRVWVTVPYFIPDLGLFRSLRLAAKRGLDVRILLPGTSDLRLLDAASKSYFGLALRSGIKLYAYGPSVLHAKVVICDDNWATFGSMNWDSMSFRYNLEGNIVVSNKKTIAELAGHFLQDLSVSTETTLELWSKRSRSARYAEALLWPFHGLL